MVTKETYNMTNHTFVYYLIDKYQDVKTTSIYETASDIESALTELAEEVAKLKAEADRRFKV